MAIIEELGLQATILINNEAAPEYPDTEQPVHGEFGPNTKEYYTYVRSVAGAEFAIKCDITSQNSEVTQWLAAKDHAIAFQVQIDGGRLNDGRIATREWPSVTLDGVLDGTNELIRKFCFTTLSTVDDSSKSRVAKDIELTKNLGKVRVHVYRVVLTTTLTKAIPIKQSPLEVDIAEKALKGKAISHGSTLNAAVRTAPQLMRFCIWKDSLDAPLAVFHFKYRSTDDLQKEMIIPRPRVPSPEAENDEDNDLNNLSREEIERLARERLAELRKRKASTAIKRENEDSVARPKRSYKYARTADGKKAIDFTQEDGDE